MSVKSAASSKRKAAAGVSAEEKANNDTKYSSDSSQVEEEEEDEEEKEVESEEDEDSFPLKKKSKKSKHDDGSADFSSAVNAILSSHLKAYDRHDPIMARNKKVLKQKEEDKLESQARRELLVEKKKRLEKARKKDIIPAVTDSEQSGEEIRQVLEKEAKLKKIAQKGVVKLFNAILSTQVKTEHELSTTLDGIGNQKERKQLVTEVSKEKFLDLVKAAGTDASAEAK